MKFQRSKAPGSLQDDVDDRLLGLVAFVADDGEVRKPRGHHHLLPHPQVTQERHFNGLEPREASKTILMTLWLDLMVVTENGASESIGKKDLELLKKRKKDACDTRYS